MPTTIDLHIHSNVSDGSLSPTQIIDTAKKNNVSIISITDHDSTDAYTKNLFLYAKENNITLIPGVEISTKIDKVGFHILGYNINLKDKTFATKLKELRESRHTYLFDVAKKLNEIGYIVQTEQLDQIDAVTKAHIALDVINNPINHQQLINNFNKIPTKGEFIESTMNEGCPAYAKKQSITPLEASNLIKSAGGKVVLAHPVVYKHEDNVDTKQIQEIINQINPDGIESNYIYVNRYNQVFDESKFWNDFAINNNLIATVGSDFHKTDNIRPEIGFVNSTLFINNSQKNQILNLLSECQPEKK